MTTFASSLPFPSDPLVARVSAAAAPDHALRVQVALVEAVLDAKGLGPALHAVAELLARTWQARAWSLLRVDDWNGSTGLVYPWEEDAREAHHHVDLSLLSTVRHDDGQAGQAIALHGPVWAGETASLWLPVWSDDTPVAVLHWQGLASGAADAGRQPLLALASRQLGLLARSELARSGLETQKEHLRRLSLVAAHATSGVIVADSDGRIEWVNEGFTRITGVAADQAVGCDAWELFRLGPEPEAAAQRLERAVRARRHFRLQYEAARPLPAGGTEPYWAEIEAAHVLDEHRARFVYLGVLTDITERQRHTDQLERERRWLDTLIEHLPVSLFIIDPTDLRLMQVNRQAEREFGVRREELLGQSPAQAYGHRLTELLVPSVRRALRDESWIEDDIVWATRARGERRLNVRYLTLRHHDGVPHALMVVARDVTDAHKAQAALLESEARFREFVDTVDDHVFITTPDRRSYDYLGPRLYHFWGVTPQELTVDPACAYERIPAEDRAVIEQRRQMEEQLQPTDVLHRVVHPDRGLRWMRTRTRSQRRADGSICVYGISTDVTAEHDRERELQRARDLAEAASLAKSQFMANMSHEIRTPMNGILGMTELLLGTALSEKQRRFAQAVYRSGENLLEIINDILDFSRIEAGKMELARSDFVLRSVVEDTLELLAPRAHEKRLELTFREAPGVPPLVHGDALRLRQVLTNLVANAIKFTESGEVVVDLACREAPPELAPPVEPDQTAVVLAFTVRDTGIGIEADVLPRLFSAFTQANSGTAKRYGGTGLGLAISRQLVDLMGGQIEVRSLPGMGSEFSFTVPVCVSPFSNAAAELDALDMPNLKVLVVEDHDTNRAVLENMLGAWGLDVTCAVDGQAALEVIERESREGRRFDLALVDMQMPRLNGLQFARVLRETRPELPTKLILLSSVSSPDDVRLAHEVGFQRYLAKPVRKVELRQAILGVSSTPSRVSAPAPRYPHQVLVVEDNPVNQEVIQQMLRRLGCQVHIAASGLEGLRSLCEHRFELVLMDIQMPGMDGVETLRWFRRGPGGRFAFVTAPQTPVVAVTANALGGDEERFLDQGFNDYLSKPFRQNQLLAVLARWLPEAEPLAAMEPEPAVPMPDSSSPETRMRTPDPDVFDAQAVQRLRDLDPKGENQLLDRLFRTFEASLQRLIPQMVEAHDVRDVATIRLTAHTLKSSCASVGALKLSTQCADIEAVIRNGSAEPLDERIVAVRDEADRVLDSLKHYLKDAPPA
jgi:two-component system, sensor histidine kinase and response regulator